ncbi:peptidase domain-containing ABC transporter [Azospirillum himalayense]|uniref:Peptidase domain-containing ABC transporter n=1 Tax=Azospirillum himalayense TaxID=654847 RepID=A0ABW0GDV0_9PROT
MSVIDRIHLGFRRRIPVILQVEVTECGLACLGMVAGYYGHRTDMATLRGRFPTSLKGVTLAQLNALAAGLNLASRAVRLELEDIPNLRLPCILHWDLDHFVVLKAVGKTHAVIIDPAFGERRITTQMLSKSFTGVALELWPGGDFKAKKDVADIPVRQLFGRFAGIWPPVIKIILLSFSLELFSVIMPLILQLVIDNAIVSGDRDLLETMGIGFILVLLLSNSVQYIRSYIIMHLSTSISFQIKSNIFSHMLNLPIRYFESRHVGDIVSRFGSADVIQKTLASSFFTVLLDGTMGVIVLIVMFAYSQLLAFIVIGASVLYGLIRWAWFGPMRNANEELVIHTAKQQTHFLETIRGIKTIKLFQRQATRVDGWLSFLVEQVNADLRTQRQKIVYQAVSGTISGLQNIVVIWVGAHMVMDGQFTVGMLMSFSAYKNQFDSRITSLIEKMVELRMLRLHGERLSDIVFSQPDKESGSPVPAKDKAGPPVGLELTNVSFRYSPTESPILTGINLRIGAGESVAIVGPSGCGKTTLMNVLLGALEPTEGGLSIDGKVGGVARLRQISGVVTQNDTLFDGSILNNICFFDQSPDREWAARCAMMAAIHNDIIMMPMGYNTLVGDMGAILSGGQKQRVLLARALYGRPRILFLDEATSHLDPRCEQEVNASVGMLKVTKIIIAHRIETISSVDRVVMLEKGKIIIDETASAFRERIVGNEKFMMSFQG